MSKLNIKANGSKLTEEQIMIIRDEYAPSRVIELAQRFSVTQETIRNVAKRHTFSWVK